MSIIVESSCSTSKTGSALQHKLQQRHLGEISHVTIQVRSTQSCMQPTYQHQIMVVANVLTPVCPQNRQQWAHYCSNWTPAHWNEVLFTDEPMFCLCHNDVCQTVGHHPRKRHAKCCALQHDRLGRTGLMVLAGMSTNSGTPLVTINGNLTVNQYMDSSVKNTSFQCAGIQFESPLLSVLGTNWCEDIRLYTNLGW